MFTFLFSAPFQVISFRNRQTLQRHERSPWITRRCFVTFAVRKKCAVKAVEERQQIIVGII